MISKKFKILIAISIIVFLLIGIYSFILTPRRISGNNVGNYNSGDMALFVSKRLSIAMRPLKKGDIISFNRSDMEMEGIALIDGVSGDEMDDIIYYFSNEKIGNIVPNDYYVVRFSGSDYLRAVSKSDVLWVEWFSLTK